MQRKAVECGFYQKSSKLLPSKFFEILLYSASHNGPFSLSQFSCEAAVCSGIQITKQSLDERFDQRAVSFVKSVLEDQLNDQIDQNFEPNLFQKFSRIRIKDSTRFDLPDRLKEKFPGIGGKYNSEAGISIQHEYDLKNGKILEFDINSVKRSDYRDAKEKISDIEEGDLIIRDLGYFSSEVLKEIMVKKAYFLSRLKANMIVYDDNLNEISFQKLYSRMVKSKRSHVEMQVYIGEKEKIPVRLMVDLMPEEIYQKRIRITEKVNKRKGCKTSEEYRSRARFNLFVTNVAETDLPGKHLYMLYKVRWQIELMFKAWKSSCGIDKIHPMRYHRLMCLLYAKFILILINNQIINLFQCRFYRKNELLLSYRRCFDSLMNYFYKTRKILFSANGKTNSYMHEISLLFSKNHWLEKRKKRINYVDIIKSFLCISNIYEYI